MLELTPSVWIVIPCYNEARRLPVDAIRLFSSRHPAVGLCFVDDGSSDDTGEVLRRLTDEGAPRLLAIGLPANAGKAEAVRTGMLRVLERERPEWVGYWDADLATPLEEVPRFLELAHRLPEVALFLGSRVRRLGAQVQRRLARHYLGRIFATCASAVLGLPVYDTQCGAKLIRADLARVLFDRPFLSRWIFDVELLARAIAVLGRERAMTAICEIPLEQWNDVGGSRVRPIHFLRAPLELLRIRRTYRTLTPGPVRAGESACAKPFEPATDAGAGLPAARPRSISAVTLAVRDMGRAVAFYQSLGLVLKCGGPDAPFSSLRLGKQFINIFVGDPNAAGWQGWGRVILYVGDVDAMHARVLALGHHPHFPPRDADWGERYFHLSDPDGHELSFARPLQSNRQS